MNVQHSAILMSDLGIETVVLIPYSALDAVVENFIVEPDFGWAEGKGKAFLFKRLLKVLRAEDVFLHQIQKMLQENLIAGKNSLMNV